MQRLVFVFAAIALTTVSAGASAKPPKSEAGPANGPGSLASRLTGLTAQNARDLLGEPALKRSENGAEDWQYQRDGCALHLYLYVKLPKGGLRVQYVDAFRTGATLPIGPTPPAERQYCLKLFLDPPNPGAKPANPARK